MPAYSGRTCLRPLAAAAVAAVVVGVGAFQSARVRATGPMYTATDLGALNCCDDSFHGSAALAVNIHGDVAGTTASPTNPQQTIPFVFQNGVMTAISDNYGWATGINDAGRVTGFVWLPGNPNVHAFLYQNGVFTDLGALPGYSNQPYSIGWGINNKGTVVGESNASAWVAAENAMSILKRQSARYASAINDAGDIVGLLSPVAGTPHANHGFLFSGNSLIDLGTLDGDPISVSMPVGINARRQITGVAWKNSNSEERAFVWENGAFRELPLLEQRPGYDTHYAFGNGINNLGDVVGESNTYQFVYRNGVMINLDGAIVKDAGGIWPAIWSARAINDVGQIAGTCYFGGDGAHACLLTPVAQ
jgi:probable HAF family extracellular repeat protein